MLDNIKVLMELMGLHILTSSTFAYIEDVASKYGKEDGTIRLLGHFDMREIMAFMERSVPPHVHAIIVESILTQMCKDEWNEDINWIYNQCNSDLEPYDYRLNENDARTLQWMAGCVGMTCKQDPSIQEVFTAGWDDEFRTITLCYVIPHVGGKVKIGSEYV